MYRKVAVAMAVGSLAIPSILILPAIAGDTSSAVVVPRPGPDADGDGYETTRVEAVLDAGSTLVDLPGAPDSVFLHGLPPGSHLDLRLHIGGTWGEPFEVTASADESPDGATIVSAVGPLWVRGADRMDVTVADGPTEVVFGAIHRVAPISHGASTATTTIPTTSSTTSATTTTSTTSATTSSTSTSTTTTSTPAQTDPPESELPYTAPFIRPRSDWATDDMGWACAPDDLVDVGAIDAAVVHHTAGRNDYAAAEVPAIIRSIWHYHVVTRGWCDIAYNFVIDRYGQAWEARQGGIAKAIRGGHTRGFNTGTTGIAQLGDFQAQSTPPAASEATRRLLGWKLGVHAVDPTTTRVVVNNSGTDVHGTADGDEMEIPTIVAHRDLGATACPGDFTYAFLDWLRRGAVVGTKVASLQRAFVGDADPDAHLELLELAEDEGLPAVAEDIAYSDAYAGVVVDDLYQTVLGRPAEPDGRAYWLSRLADGMRIEKLSAIFYGSEEYIDAAGSTEAWVTALYDRLLHRSPESAGLSFWTATLDGDYQTAPEIAEGFFASIESRFDRVVRLYDRFLGRTPEPDGQVYWADQLLHHDDLQLAIFLSLSDEFFQRATS